MAIVLVLLGVVALFAVFLSQLVPILGNQVFRFTHLLPGKDDIRQYVDDLRQWYLTLPEPTQGVIDSLLDQIATTVRDNLDVYFSRFIEIAIQTVLNLVNTVAFVLGFLVVPAWLLAVLKDQRSGVETIDRTMPEWMRDDFWALVRIVDRTFRAFIDGQLMLGIIVGVLVYLGLALLEALGADIADYKLLVALFAGIMQLIPSVGPIVTGVVFFVGGALIDIEAALILLALFILIEQLVGRFVAPHLERRYIVIHPAILVVSIVALSEFGIFWILLAAPLTAIIRDIFRYVYGRFGDPPLPAGVLPGALDSAGLVQSSTEPEPSTIRVPLAYRRGRAARSQSTRADR
jgi:predicted PurR-regulated permease PerM